MSDYIKREDFEHTLVNEMPNIQPIMPNAIAVDVAKKLSEMIPSADVVEVRHGHWIDVGADLDGAWYYRCSVCGSDAVDGYEYPLCPYCGARMDGEEE